MGKRLKVILGLVVALGLVLAGWKVLDPQQLGEVARRFDRAWLVPLLLAPVAYLWLKSYRFAVLMACVVPLPGRVMMKGYASTQAATLIPGGFAARAAIMEEVDGNGAEAAGPTLATGLMDNLAFLTTSLVAAFFYPQARGAALVLAIAVGLAGVALAFPAVRRVLRKGIERVADRLGCRPGVEDALEGVGRFMSPRPLLMGGGLTGAAFLVEAGALWASLHALGVEISFATAVLAWVVSISVGRLSPAPGGVGVTEAGMVTLMATLGGISVAEAAAATLLFRIVTLFLPALLGTAVYVLAWRGRQEDAGPAADASAPPAVGWVASPSLGSRREPRPDRAS